MHKLVPISASVSCLVMRSPRLQRAPNRIGKMTRSPPENLRPNPGIPAKKNQFFVTNIHCSRSSVLLCFLFITVHGVTISNLKLITRIFIFLEHSMWSTSASTGDVHFFKTNNNYNRIFKMNQDVAHVTHGVELMELNTYT